MVVTIVVCAAHPSEVVRSGAVTCSVIVVPVSGAVCGAPVLCGTRNVFAVMVRAVLGAVVRGATRVFVVSRCGGERVGICILSGLHVSNWAVIPAVRDFFSYVPNGVV